MSIGEEFDRLIADADPDPFVFRPIAPRTELRDRLLHEAAAVLRNLEEAEQFGPAAMRKPLSAARLFRRRLDAALEARR